MSERRSPSGALPSREFSTQMRSGSVRFEGGERLSAKGSIPSKNTRPPVLGELSPHKIASHIEKLRTREDLRIELPAFIATKDVLDQTDIVFSPESVVEVCKRTAEISDTIYKALANPDNVWPVDAVITAEESYESTEFLDQQITSRSQDA